MDEKKRNRLSKKFGPVPRELEIGRLVDHFKQTPWQLGFCKEPDLGLLYRCLQAARIDEIAHKMDDITKLSIEEFKLISPLNDAIK